MKNKKILITGSSGFIGSKLKEKCNSMNLSVVSYSLTDGRDINNKKQIKEFVKQGFDYIFHLAAFSGNKKSATRYETCLKTNTLATLSILNSIVKYSPKTKIIFSSSRLEYGSPKYLPVDEKHRTEPLSPYGLSKLAATLLANLYRNSNELRFTVFRTSNVYGPHNKSNFADYNILNHFIDLAKNNKTIKIFGDGEQLRDYIYIDDLVAALIRAMNQKADGQVYNVGFGKGISIAKMANLIVEIVGKGKVKKVPWPKEWKKVETGSYVSNIKKISSELNFKPKINFKDGIKKTVYSD